jgi:formylglycine-generating enzyme required for sulfatase activity
MKTTTLLKLLLLVLFFDSCMSMNVEYDNLHYQSTTLPGIVKIDSSLMIDETEVTNFHWSEYMYWTKRVFGKNSDEYKAIIPDTNCWKKLDTSYTFLSKNYLRTSIYSNYPVVGITQKQAEAFSKWRSDRVFAYILIGCGFFEWRIYPNPDDYFTIERYFAGEYLDVKMDSNHLYYPVYSLPSIKEWKNADKNYDSLMNETIKYPRNKKKLRPEGYYNFIHSGYAGVKFIRNSYINVSYTVPVYSGFSPQNSNYQLKGNVSEWTTSPDTTIGGGWHDTRAAILNDTIFRCDTSNAWTGFRCVAHWEKWIREE